MNSLWLPQFCRKCAALALWFFVLVLLGVACEGKGAEGLPGAGAPALAPTIAPTSLPESLSSPTAAPSPMVLTAVTATPTFTIVPRTSPSATVTQTRVIGAVERATPTPTDSPNTEHWKGTVHSETNANYGKGGMCTGEAWDFTLDIAIAPDKSVYGSGLGVLASMPQCSGPGFRRNYQGTQAHNSAFSVLGTKMDQAFDLQFSETMINGETNGLVNYSLLLRSAGVILEVPITGPDRAEAQITIERTIPTASVTAKHTVRLQCTTCK